MANEHSQKNSPNWYYVILAAIDHQASDRSGCPMLRRYYVAMESQVSAYYATRGLMPPATTMLIFVPECRLVT